MTFDRDVFFGDLQERTGVKPRALTRARIGFLLDHFEGDDAFTQVRDLAYVLATIRWETAQSFQPVAEKRASRELNPRLREIQDRYWPSGFFGRRYVQITWERNYRTASERLAGTTVVARGKPLTIDAETLVRSPDLVLEPEVSYTIAARGMREGWFTGKKLSHFIRDGEPPDYVNARKIINGLDQAERIATYANAFELVLRAATTNANT